MGKVNSALPIDISFAGCILRIDGTEINDFTDSENPFEVSDCEIADTIFSVNGRMTRVTKPSAILLSVTVIFGSQSHIKLGTMWKQRFLNNGDASINSMTNGKPISAVIVHPKVGALRFDQGTMISGPALGGSASAAGKMNGVTYTFAFAKIS